MNAFILLEQQIPLLPIFKYLPMILEKSFQSAYTWNPTKQGFLVALLPAISAPSLKLEDIGFNTSLLFVYSPVSRPLAGYIST